MEPELIVKLKKIRDTYTFDWGKVDVDEEIKQVRQAIIRANMMKHDSIKDLIKAMKRMIDEITLSLGKDRTLTERERDKLFERRDAFEWLVSFFESSEATIKKAEEIIKEELKE